MNEPMSAKHAIPLPEMEELKPGRELVLLTGATGYVGGRLLRALEDAGHRVRCLARRPQALASRTGASTEVVAGECLDIVSLTAALLGVHTAYYLVHSMASPGKFEEGDRRAAHNFARAARAAGVRRIIVPGRFGRTRAGAFCPRSGRRRSSTRPVCPACSTGMSSTQPTDGYLLECCETSPYQP